MFAQDTHDIFRRSWHVQCWGRFFCQRKIRRSEWIPISQQRCPFASFGRTKGAVQPCSVELISGAECWAVSVLPQKSQPRISVSVTRAVAWKRWRRALAYLRSRLNGGRDTDELSAVFI